MATCFIHASTEAAGECADCKKAICAQCTTGTLDGFMCPGCAAKRQGRRTLKVALKIGALALVLVAVAVFGLIVVGRGNERAEVPKDPKTGKPVGEQDPYIESLVRLRDAAPCDKAAVRKLVKEYSEMKRHAEAVDAVAAYFKQCGDDFLRLKQDAIYALEQLGRHKDAVAYATQMINEEPFDSDFWWWRAEDQGKSGENTLALADYRQSFGLSKDAGYSRFAAARVLDVAVPAKRPCEAVFALDYFTAFHGGELRASTEEKARGIDTSEQCDAKRGKGKLELSGEKVEVVIGAAKGSFLIDPQCGTTALATAFAQKAQVTGRSGPPVDVLTQGAIRSGQLATATLVIGGKATAPDTEVVIADGLPAGVDGVLGLSAVWKFDLERTDDGGLLLTGTDQ